MKLTAGQVATILGAAPQIAGIPRDTPLALWHRLRTGAPDPAEKMKMVSRALEVGLLPMLGAPPTGGICVALSCLWYTGDQLAVDGIDRYAMTVCQRKMAEAGASKARVGLLLAGGAWRTWVMAAVPEFAAEMELSVEDFMDSLARGVPPAISDEGDLEAIKRLWPDDKGAIVALPEQAARMWTRLKALKKSRRALGKEAALIEAHLRNWLGAAREGRLPKGGRLALRTIRTPNGRGRRLVELE